MGNGTDDWRGPPLASEVQDQKKDAVVNTTKQVDGKTCLQNSILDQFNGVAPSQQNSMDQWDAKVGVQQDPPKGGTQQEPVGYAAGVSGDDDAKTSSTGNETVAGR